ncbi:uncharacterized protein LOC131935225 [Physella acuta]|uniref:uncharacterized protein LOC131935225 n=1 Tax=Physella acuta TaxID=109671 RepID=UPI0027DDBA16|nr:uncharacterized protein LOC131935225 [Physella acuta]
MLRKQNKVITPDVDKTPWLHIVKSGQVKVVRCQYVADVRADSSPREGEATQGRSSSSTHAQAMLGNLTKQRRLRKRNNISLPELMRRHVPRGGRDGGKKSLSAAPTPGYEVQVADPHSGGSLRLRGESATVLPAITVSFQDTEPPPPDKPSSANESLRLETPMERLARQPQRVFLTREKTTAEPEVLPEKLRREKPVRATCVQLDVLRPGDIFGLEDVAKKLRFDTGDMDEEETDRSLPEIHPLNSFGKSCFGE